MYSAVWRIFLSASSLSLLLSTTHGSSMSVSIKTTSGYGRTTYLGQLLISIYRDGGPDIVEGNVCSHVAGEDHLPSTATGDAICKLQGFDQLDWIQYSGDRYLFARTRPVSMTNVSCHNINGNDNTISCNFFENVTCDGGASAYRYYTAISCKCNDGYYKTDRGCESCPYYRSSGNLTFCECNDPSSEFSKEWDKDSYCNYCPLGTYKPRIFTARPNKDDDCLPCPEGLTTYDTGSRECICPEGGKHIFGKCVSNGKVAGVAVGAAVVLLLACCCWCCCCRRSRSRRPVAAADHNINILHANLTIEQEPVTVQVPSGVNCQHSVPGQPDIPMQQHTNPRHQPAPCDAPPDYNSAMTSAYLQAPPGPGAYPQAPPGPVAYLQAPPGPGAYPQAPSAPGAYPQVQHAATLGIQQSYPYNPNFRE